MGTWSTATPQASFTDFAVQLPVKNLTPSSSQTIPAGWCCIVSDHFEILTGLTMEIGTGGVLEIT